MYSRMSKGKKFIICPLSTSCTHTHAHNCTILPHICMLQMQVTLFGCRISIGHLPGEGFELSTLGRGATRAQAPPSNSGVPPPLSYSSSSSSSSSLSIGVGRVGVWGVRGRA